jgi:hypothetical protein
VTLPGIAGDITLYMSDVTVNLEPEILLAQMTHHPKI